MVDLQFTLFFTSHFSLSFFCQTLVLSFKSILSFTLVLILLINNYFVLFCFVLNHLFSIASLIFDSIYFFITWSSLFWFLFILSSIFFYYCFSIWSFKSILSPILVLILLIVNCFFNHFFSIESHIFDSIFLKIGPHCFGFFILSPFLYFIFFNFIPQYLI
jgi:hypothetical protein